VNTSTDTERLRALTALGLGARPDADMDYFARRVRDQLGVPLALVSLVQADHQVFPGQCGLAQPWASERRTPLSHSFCQHVVASGEPLVVTDARTDPALSDNLAITDLGAVGYAGMPLTDTNGTVLGSLCAMDTAPHAWTAAELDMLRDIARACATELRLRLARHDADAERARAKDLQDLLSQSLLRSQLLLTASESLSDVASVNELRAQIDDLVAGDLKPARVTLVVTQDVGLQTKLEDQRDTENSDDGQWGEFDASGATFVARAVRERRLVHVPDLRATDVADETASYLDDGLVAVTCAPIADSTGVLGVLELAWEQPHDHDPLEQAVIATIAGYVASALQRARFLQHRISVTHDLQDAMLTDLPDIPGLRLTARYHPADTAEQVGGDWYDAFPVRDKVAVAIGDITGHDIHAATAMGQLRAMLRQACWQGQPCHTPAAAVTALDDAVTGLDFGASGTALLAYLTETGNGGWDMTWTNAGHPPPILIHPDHRAEILHPHNHLLGFADTFAQPRTDNRVTLAPGSSILLYTDGLVERPRVGIDGMIADLAEVAADMHSTDPAHLADTILRRTTHAFHHDDIALLVVHVPE
jgi:serine phosphatase RsbU (regulator of sigma subunit)